MASTADSTVAWPVMMTTSAGDAGRPDLPEDFHAVDARHHQIDQDDVEIAGQGRLQPGFGHSKILHLVPFGFQRPLAAQADHRFVVDDQNPQCRFGGFCFCCI